MSPRPTAHVDPRSPYVLDTRELGRRPGSMLEFRREVPAPDDWGLELVKVPSGTPVELDLRLESVVDGVLVTAEVHAPLTAECGRCLEPVETVLDVPVTELFVYDAEPDDDEVPALDGDFVDLEAVLRDAVVLALPLNPVCSEDCSGLCVGCGERLDDLEPGHSHDVVDPRWAALSGLNPATLDTTTPSSATMDAPDPADGPASTIRES
jgi:uncharacterized protein